MIAIQSLPSARWQEYRALRLEALQREPAAFGSSYEEDVLMTEAEWKRRLPDHLFAVSKGRVVGMVAYVVEKKMKLKHIANLYAVYVTPEFRGRGVGEQLIARALEAIQRNRDVVKICLNVNAEQASALKVYQHLGFTVVGRLEKDLCVNGRYYDELMMVKFLRQG